jgi:ubiquinol-cytochrome c reductase cytochrome c subunit
MSARLVAVLVVAAALPAGAHASLVQKGERLYGRYCVACHGPQGAGRSIAPSLRGVGARAADFYLTTGYMPLRHLRSQPRRARPLLEHGQIRALVTYVSSLGHGPPVPQPHPEHGDLSAGQHAFAEHCAGCHQIVASGGYVTGAVPPGLGRATATQIAEAVRIGPYVMPAFSSRTISDRELDSIVRYILWTRHPPDPGGWSLGHIGPVPEGLVTWFLAGSVLVAVCLVLGKRVRRG